MSSIYSKTELLELIHEELQKQTMLLTEFLNKQQQQPKSNPLPPALQEKLQRMGYGNWTPTPGVSDEDRELYLSLGDQHLYVMPVLQALNISDEALKAHIDVRMHDENLKKQAMAEYERRRSK